MPNQHAHPARARRFAPSGVERLDQSGKGRMGMVRRGGPPETVRDEGSHGRAARCPRESRLTFWVTDGA
jgi:hypothetical protein